VEDLAGTTKVLPAGPERDNLIHLGNGGQVKMLPTSLLEQAPSKVVNLQALHY
jgi:hypothetical protein